MQPLRIRRLRPVGCCADPAITAQRRPGIDSAFSDASDRAGRVDVALRLECARRQERPRRRPPPRPPRPARASTSETSTSAPSAASSVASVCPTEPTPCTSTRRPASSGEPNRCSTLALDRVQHADRRATTAVPAGARSFRTPRGKRSATMSRSAGVMFMSPAVRYVPPSDGHELGVPEQQRAPLGSLRQRGHGEHRLAATAVGVRDRHLHGHRLRQPHRVGEAVGGRGVDAKPRAAARRTAGGRVDADEHPRAALAVEPDDGLLAVPAPAAAPRTRPEVCSTRRRSRRTRYTPAPWLASASN